MATGLSLLAVGLLWMTTLDPDTTFVDLVGPLVVSSLGLGFVMSPATSAIMTAAPDEKQGVASAVNDATRELGAAIGIAVAGSVLAAQYRDSLAPAVADLPAGPRAAATDSLSSALAVSEKLGPAGTDLARFAEAAFVHAMGQALYALCAALFVGAAALVFVSPGRQGRQWALPRRRRGRHWST